MGPVPIDTGTVEVVRDRDDPRSVTVLVNGVPSSHLDLDDPTRLDFEYMQLMAAFVDHLPARPLAVTHLGAGACTLPRWVEAARPGSRQIAVDVDARLLALVREWFDLPRSPRLRLRPGDAREVLASLPAASQDVVVRDAFAGDVTPAHLADRGFVLEVARVLRPDGLYLANCADRPPLARARAELATLRSVLPDVALAAEPGLLRGRRYGNLVLAAGGVPAGPGSAEVRDAPAGRPHRSRFDDPALARTLRCLPVPARLVVGDEVVDLVGAARPVDLARALPDS